MWTNRLRQSVTKPNYSTDPYKKALACTKRQQKDPNVIIINLREPFKTWFGMMHESNMPFYFNDGYQFFVLVIIAFGN